MNLKLLFVITDDEVKINKLINKYELPFSNIFHGIGTASKSTLDYFGLVPSEKEILISIISDNLEEKIFKEINNIFKIKKAGKGIGFTIPLSSASKYVNDFFIKEEGMKKMEKKKEYHLIVTIAQEGYADTIINAAKKNGANGGTLIQGRSVGEKNNFKLFNMTIESEKDIVLIVANRKNKNNIMNGILEKTGVKKDGKALCFSLPIDNAIGLEIEE